MAQSPRVTLTALPLWRPIAWGALLWSGRGGGGGGGLLHVAVCTGRPMKRWRSGQVGCKAGYSQYLAAALLGLLQLRCCQCFCNRRLEAMLQVRELLLGVFVGSVDYLYVFRGCEHAVQRLPLAHLAPRRVGFAGGAGGYWGLSPPLTLPPPPVCAVGTLLPAALYSIVSFHEFAWNIVA